MIEDLSAIVGPRHCVTAPEEIEPYLIEIRGLYRGAASAVVRPGSTDEVAAVVGLCAARGVPMVAQGGNTGQCGGGVPTGGASGVVISTDRLARIRAVDAAAFTITVEAGCLLADVQSAAARVDRLFPLSLGSEGSCRIGGNLSTNAGGTAVLRYGNARDLVLGLEVVLPNGQVWNGLRTLRKDNTGYALKHLFVGAEGTLGVITAAALKLFPARHDVATAFVAVASPKEAIALLGLARQAADDAVTAFELIPRTALDVGLRNLGGARDPFDAPSPWYALVEFSCENGTARLETFLSRAMEDRFVGDAVVGQSVEQGREFWQLREIAAGGHQFAEGALVKHDISLPIPAIPEMIDRGASAVEAAAPGTRVFAFGHAGDGNLHYNLVQPVGADPDAFRARTQELNRIVHDLVDSFGGSISAEHGIGLLKIDELARYRSPVEIDMMRKIKAALDPKSLMNPGKIFAQSAHD